MGKWYWLLLRLITCIFLYCLLNVGRYSLLRVQSDAANSQKRTVNYKTAHRNRNIASFNYERRLIDEKFPSDKTNQKKDSDKINNFSPKFGPVFETGVWSERASNPNRIDLDDVYISVKTSKQFHETRLPIILDTWFEQARNQVRVDLALHDLVFVLIERGQKVIEILFLNLYSLQLLGRNRIIIY